MSSRGLDKSPEIGHDGFPDQIEWRPSWDLDGETADSFSYPSRSGDSFNGLRTRRVRSIGWFRGRG